MVLCPMASPGFEARPRFPAGLLSHCSGRLSLQTTTAQYPVSKKPLVLLFGFAPISSKKYYAIEIYRNTLDALHQASFNK